MEYWTKYNGHSYNVLGKRKKYDDTIYTFDIETSSFIIFDGVQYPAIKYKDLSSKEQQDSEFHSCMYIWQLGINDKVYFGRTWQELILFLDKINKFSHYQKFMFVHNLSFEFQYLKSYFNINNVMARKSRSVMSCDLTDFNFTLKCTLYMTNTALKNLSDMYNLPVKKLVGDLDYEKVRNSKTKLSKKELDYCEYDCLVVYHYIKFELKLYGTLKDIPSTLTGHVRKELKELTLKDYRYKRKVRMSVNTEPHIYNLLVEAFQGGYTHANWIYTDKVIKNVDSWDFTSSYPYVMVTYKYPSTEFKKCYITNVSDMYNCFAYLLVVKFTNIESKYFNNFISSSKCKNIKGAKYDNGRIMKADEFEMTLTDVDFKLILDSYNCEYEILESYYSYYDYLPIKLIDFILDKYVIKTQYKGIEEKKQIYAIEKSKFNSLYGMSVTKNIRDEVVFDNETKEWSEIPLTNEQIQNELFKEKKMGFLSFSYGVWITAYARNNLLQNVMKLDEDVVYCDTDSIKLISGYDKKVIEDYNKSVIKRINNVSKKLNINFYKFAPKDVKGKERIIGLFDDDGHYDEFITQGAKKYAVKTDEKISITVSGVPKEGAKALKKLSDFKDNLIFRYEDTEKQLISYVENQEPIEVIDYNGNKNIQLDISGCCLVPTTYELGKAFDYAELVSENTSKRSIYKEGD